MAAKRSQQPCTGCSTKRVQELSTSHARTLTNDVARVCVAVQLQAFAAVSAHFSRQPSTTEQAPRLLQPQDAAQSAVAPCSAGGFRWEGPPCSQPASKMHRAIKVARGKVELFFVGRSAARVGPGCAPTRWHYTAPARATVMAVMYTMVSTEEPCCSTLIDLRRPRTMGPMTGASPSEATSL